MLKRCSLIVVLLLQWHCVTAYTQVEASPQVEPRKFSQPYSGDLSIFESPGRDQRLQINRVMKILGITPGKVVADIGAGSGWFTVASSETSWRWRNCICRRYQPGSDPLY